MFTPQNQFSSFTLDNFEGPLTFLLQLVQKSEIAISEVSLKEILTQYLGRFQGPDMNSGAEFISTTASLLWLKSKQLLPSHEQEESTSLTLEENSPFSILPQLIEYLQFKQLAKDLSERELQQQGSFVRGTKPLPTEVTKPTIGLGSTVIEDLALLFQLQLQKFAEKKKEIQEEVWRVSDAMSHLKQRLKLENKIDAATIFTHISVVDELVVLFLATLELMKQGDMTVFREPSSEKIWLIGKGEH